MQDLLSLFDKGRAQPDTSALRELGEQAASLHLKGNLPLDKALVKVLADANHLNPSHMQRVVEAANIAVNTTLFQQEGAKTFTFNPAIPDKVLQDVQAAKMEASLPGGEVSPEVARDDSYLTAPEDYHDSPDLDLNGLFPIADGGTYPMANPSGEIERDFMDAEGQLAHVQAKVAARHMQADLAMTDFLEQAADAYLGGTSLGDIAGICESVAENEKVAEVMGRVLIDHLAGYATVDALQDSLEKRAHRVPNPEHPLVKTAGAMAFFTYEAMESADEARKFEKLAQDLRTKLIEVQKGGR